jgi:hypothetical protein
MSTQTKHIPSVKDHEPKPSTNIPYHNGGIVEKGDKVQLTDGKVGVVVEVHLEQLVNNITVKLEDGKEVGATASQINEVEDVKK